ncbi:MAG: ADP-ribosyltransferase domain-containing protein [Oligoflexales bacterium]
MKSVPLRFITFALFSITLPLGCKQRTHDSSRPFNSEASNACLAETDPAGCGISFPQDFKASEEMYPTFRNKWEDDIEDMKAWEPERIAAGAEHGLTEEEVTAIFLYTTKLYKEINTELRANALSEQNKPLVYLAASGLRKLPRVLSKVFRGTHLEPDVKEKYVRALKNSLPVQELGFVSTTEDQTYLAEHFTLNAQYFIESATGASVVDFSQFPEEKEVLFAPGSWFQVIEVKDTTFKELPGTVIMMKELLPN